MRRILLTTVVFLAIASISISAFAAEKKVQLVVPKVF